jgi:hypothetical protein
MAAVKFQMEGGKGVEELSLSLRNTLEKMLPKKIHQTHNLVDSKEERREMFSFLSYFKTHSLERD